MPEAWTCIRCHREGVDPVVRHAADQFTVEVALKSRDGGYRPKQATAERVCRRHGAEVVEQVRARAKQGQAIWA